MRTARPELVRRTLLLLEGSPAALDMREALRMAAEGGIVGGVGGGWWFRGQGLGVGIGSVESTLAWRNHMTAIAEGDACEQRAMQCMCVVVGGGDCEQRMDRFEPTAQLLSPHPRQPASPRARPNPDSSGIYPLVKRHCILSDCESRPEDVERTIAPYKISAHLLLNIETLVVCAQQFLGCRLRRSVERLS